MKKIIKIIGGIILLLFFIAGVSLEIGSTVHYGNTPVKDIPGGVFKSGGK